MNTSLLIEELTPNQANLITESSNSGDVFLNGIFMQGVVENRNGRVYPLSEITAAVKAANTMISESNGIFGELDHPQTLSINLDRISHVITEMKMVGNDAIGKAKLLNTPMGLIAKELATCGVALGVSSRGAGNVNESGGVQNFMFATVDIVAQPSAQQAYPATVLESLDMAKNGQEILKLAESIRADDAAQAYFKKEILSWLATDIFTKR